MKIISITAWWAWAIVHAGKDVENRNWHTKYRGPLLIHASKKVDDEDLEDVCRVLRPMVLGGQDVRVDFPRVPESGGIVGRCELADCVREHPSPWFFGPWGFVLRDVTPTKFIPLRGRLSLFDAPPEVLEALQLGDSE